MRRPPTPLIVAVAVVAGFVAWWLWPRGSTSVGPASTTASGSAGSGAAASGHGPSGAGDHALTTIASAPPAPVDSADVRFLAFGDAPGALGRGTTGDGRNVAPSSFLADEAGLLVLDQEKSRLLKPDGSSIPLPGKRADDVARGADGSLAVLDRLDAKDVAILDANGKVKGRFPLAGTGIDDPKDVSRLVVSGSDVYVERNGGGPLLRVGGTDGTAGTRTEIQGMPTRDGRFLVSAGITDPDQGRAWVNLADLSAVHRWTRELKFPAELSAVAFLDTDAAGSIWVVLLAGSTPADYVNWAVCLDEGTGGVKKSLTLAVENPPWESFRDYAVGPDGSLVAATRTEQGVSFASYPCR